MGNVKLPLRNFLSHTKVNCLVVLSVDRFMQLGGGSSQLTVKSPLHKLFTNLRLFSWHRACECCRNGLHFPQLCLEGRQRCFCHHMKMFTLLRLVSKAFGLFNELR